MKELLGFVLVSVAIVVTGFFAAPAQVNVDNGNLGAFSGNEITTRLSTYSGFSQGGAFTIATTASAMTLKDADLAKNATIFVTAMGAGQSALALSLPASTTWPSLDKPGVVQSWIIDATDVGTAATTTTITAGAGVDIDGITANDDIINGGVAGELRCWRLSATEEGGNIRCSVRELVDAG